MGALGEPIRGLSTGVRDDYGSSLRDSEIDLARRFSQKVQGFILSNGLLVGDEESQVMLREGLHSAGLSEGIFTNLRGDSILQYVSEDEIIAQANKLGVLSYDFLVWMGSVVYELKRDLAPGVYKSYGFSESQVKQILRDAELVKQRYANFIEATLIVGDPLYPAPTEIPMAIEPITPQSLFSEMGLPVTQRDEQNFT